VNDTLIGVGPALRKAREKRGVTLDAASRDTRLRVDQLRALEDEDFEALLGEVYVRGSLRTYAHYLGLSADKVLTAYTRHADDPTPPPPPAKLGRVERAIAATRIRDNQRVMVLLAATVLVIAIVFGFVSRGHSTPPPAALPTAAATPRSSDLGIDAVVVALADVTVSVDADGIERIYQLTQGETRTFSADASLDLAADDGAAIQLTVNGNDLGVPGYTGMPWSDSWTLGSDSAIPPP
jgi:hypothetical protein